jgi:hypothetical protein
MVPEDGLRRQSLAIAGGKRCGILGIMARCSRRKQNKEQSDE